MASALSAALVNKRPLKGNKAIQAMQKQAGVTAITLFAIIELVYIN